MSNIILYETKMTSNTAPAPFVASASSVYSNVYDAWKAFDSVTKTFWSTTYGVGGKGWIQIDFGKQTSLNKVTMTATNTTNDYKAFPKDFNILGSNDGVIFTQFAEIKNQTVSIQSEVVTYNFNTVNYRYYKIDVLSNNGATNGNVAIENITFGLLKNKNLIIKNPSTNKHYSLADKTLIPLSDASSKNMILHGIEAGKEIQLDVPFDKIKLVNSTSENLGNGKVFTHKFNISETAVNKIIL